MSRLRTRLAKLEARLDARRLAALDRLTPWEQTAFLDSVTDALIAQGLLPPPDPTQPNATIAALRLTALDTLPVWHAACKAPGGPFHQPACRRAFEREVAQRLDALSTSTRPRL